MREFLDTDGARVFDEVLSQLCEEPSVRGFYLDLCRADNLFRGSDNGESPGQWILHHPTSLTQIPMWF